MNFSDKKNLIPKALSQGLLSLELGVGSKKIFSSSISIDKLDTDACDVVGDVLDVLESLPDSCVETIYASHFIEHIEFPQVLLESLVRVCASGSTITFIAPHFSNPFFYSDPTHKSTYGLYTFCYYAKNSFFRRSIPDYCLFRELRLSNVKLSFSSYSPNYFRHFLKKVAQFIVNSSHWSQELYEEVFCWVFPCYQIMYSLSVVK